MTKKRLILTTTGLLSAALFFPASANAATVYQGSDRAYNTGSTKVTACDGEKDGHSAYSDWRANTSGRIVTSGGSGTCASATMSGLKSFNICEQIPSFPDACSNRVYL